MDAKRSKVISSAFFEDDAMGGWGEEGVRCEERSAAPDEEDGLGLGLVVSDESDGSGEQATVKKRRKKGRKEKAHLKGGGGSSKIFQAMELLGMDDWDPEHGRQVSLQMSGGWACQDTKQAKTPCIDPALSRKLDLFDRPSNDWRT